MYSTYTYHRAPTFVFRWTSMEPRRRSLPSSSLVAVLAVLVAVRSLVVVTLPPSFTSPSTRRIRRKIATLRCFLLVVVVVVVACPRCRHRRRRSGRCRRPPVLRVLHVVHARLCSTVAEDVDGALSSFSSLLSLISSSAGDQPSLLVLVWFLPPSPLCTVAVSKEEDDSNVVPSSSSSF